MASTAIFSVTPAEAADWLGTVSANWFTAGNWNPAAVPTSSTDVVVNGGFSNPANITSAGAAARALTLGNGTGQSGALNISAGGTLTSGVSNLAYDPYTAGTVTVTGAGSTWTAATLNLGMDAGAVGELNILNGGKVVAGNTYLSFGNGGTGASGTMLISGNGSSFTGGGFVYLGYGGTGTITVTGSGASFSSAGIFNIGHLSSGGPSGTGVSGNGTFNLQNGATATSGSVTLGSGLGTSGTANVSGNGTVWTTGSLTAGGSGAGLLNITAGATVKSTSGALIGDQAIISGSGSQLVLGGDAATYPYSNVALGLGVLGTTRPSSLLIEDGGKVTIQDKGIAPANARADVQIGRTGATSTLTITGTGSALTTPYDMVVGSVSGSNGIVNVTNGGTLNTGHASIADWSTSTGSATVTGANSVWTVSDSKTASNQGLFLGLSGGAATLTIADGGIVNVNSTGRAVSTGSNSIINIGNGGAAGTLNTNSVALGGGTSQINFNHTSSNYIFAASLLDNVNPPTINTATVNFLAGTTILTGHNSDPNSFSGKINISSGATAQFGNGGAAGLIKGDVANNGAMIVKVSSLSEIYSGAISGSGTFEQAGTGTLSLTGTNTFSGLTKVSSGTLQLGSNTTTGSVAGNIENNSHLSFYRSDSFTFSNLISGTGDVDKRGSGIMTLDSVQTYTGRTSVSQGTLRLGGNNRLVTTGSLFISGGTFDLATYSQTVGAFSSGTGTLATGTGSLTFGNSLDREFQGNVTGMGSLIKQGTGTQIMSGNSSAYTGTTTVNNGLLAVNGNLSNSATTVNTNGTLGGTGTVGQTTVNGTIAPGNSIGTLNVNGPYVQNAGSFYNVEVNAAGQSDLINVTGTATINGGTVRVIAGMGAYNPTTIYTILTSSGARTGTFTGVTSNFAFLDPSLTYDPNNVYLTLVRNSIDFASVGQTPNQVSAGGGLAALGMANPIVAAALMLTPDQARAAFDSLSGEIHPSLHSLMLDESALVRDAILGRQRLDTAQGWTGTFATGFAEEDEAALAYAKKMRKVKGGPKWPVKAPPPVIAPIYGAWVQGYGNWTRLNSDGNAATLRSTNGGAIGGVDVTLNHNWRFGVATGGGRTDARVDARTSTGTIDTFHVAAYGGGRISDIAFRTGASYSHHDISTTRTIAFPGFADTATASYGASTSQVFGEAAYGIVRSWVNAEAFANLAYVSVRSDRFTETGGPAALTVAQTTTSATYSTLGLRVQAPIPAIGPWAMTARGSLGWQHAYNGTTPIALMAFATSPTPFAIAGAPIARDALLVEAGLDAVIYRNTVLALLYTGRIASDANAHALKANLAVKF